MPDWLRSDEYEEPRCPLCMDTSGRQSIPQQRVIDKFDEYTHRNDYAGAERHMLYWLAEAKQGRDLRGQFRIRNEMMGLYRKTGQKEKAFAAVQATLSLIEEMQIQDSVGAATAYLNAATVYDAFDCAAQSVPLFERAERIYLANLPENDARFGGLYNNMGLSLASLGRYEQANVCYRKAIAVMQQNENGAPEQAITYLNMADAAYASQGAEDADEIVNEYLDTAQALLETPSVPRDGYYAFVCEKCAPTFTYYGRFAYGAELKERADRIYAGA